MTSDHKLASVPSVSACMAKEPVAFEDLTARGRKMFYYSW
jgi:hypothetical protein